MAVSLKNKRNSYFVFFAFCMHFLSLFCVSLMCFLFFVSFYVSFFYCIRFTTLASIVSCIFFRFLYSSLGLFSSPQPVKFLEGELIHDLLTIFVSEKLPGYIHFYNNHKEFISSIGVFWLAVSKLSSLSCVDI